MENNNNETDDLPITNPPQNSCSEVQENYLDPQSAQRNPNPTIRPPYLWARNRVCSVRSLDYLHAHDIFFISGEVRCKECQGISVVTYHLKDKFDEFCDFVSKNKQEMHGRAPRVWMRPVLEKCRLCKEENSAKPVISEKKKNINWLFLFLGQMVGCCSLGQLRYFCKHAGKNLLGDKDELLFLVYMELCHQVDPAYDVV